MKSMAGHHRPGKASVSALAAEWIEIGLMIIPSQWISVSALAAEWIEIRWPLLWQKEW